MSHSVSKWLTAAPGMSKHCCAITRRNGKHCACISLILGSTGGMHSHKNMGKPKPNTVATLVGRQRTTVVQSSSRSSARTYCKSSLSLLCIETSFPHSQKETKKRSKLQSSVTYEIGICFRVWPISVLSDVFLRQFFCIATGVLCNPNGGTQCLAKTLKVFYANYVVKQVAWKKKQKAIPATIFCIAICRTGHQAAKRMHSSNRFYTANQSWKTELGEDWKCHHSPAIQIKLNVSTSIV